MNMTMATNPLGYNILMWFLSLLSTIITTVLLPVAFKLLAQKLKNEKLKYVMEELASTVCTSVDYTNQTFVEQMKADGKFDADAQQEALTRSITHAFDNLTDSSKKIISSEGIDLRSLLESKIEAQITDNKKKKTEDK